MVRYGRVRARIDGAAANDSSRGTGMLINTFESSERAYSQDSWILIRPLHFLTAASAPVQYSNLEQPPTITRLYYWTAGLDLTGGLTIMYIYVYILCSQWLCEHPAGFLLHGSWHVARQTFNFNEQTHLKFTVNGWSKQTYIYMQPHYCRARSGLFQSSACCLKTMMSSSPSKVQ